MKHKKIYASLILFSIIFTASCSSNSDASVTDTSETVVSENTSYLEEAYNETSAETSAETIIRDESALQADFDFENTFQTMIGFGAGYTWYSERMLYPNLKDEVADLLFKDAKLTILRFKNEYGYQNVNITEKSREVQIYELAKSRADEYNEKVTVLMSCWSPPAYLKSNGTINGGGTIKKDENGEYMYSEYGEWWANSLEAYINAGLPIDFMSIQNECDYEVDYDGMELSAFESDKLATYSTAYLSVYDAIREKLGDSAPLMIAPETMTCLPATLKQYIRPILEANPDSVAGLAHHLYAGGQSGDHDGVSSCEPDTFNMNFRENYLEFGDDLPIWQTEFYRGSPLETAGIIHNSLVNENVNAYIYWGGIWGREKAVTDVIAIESGGKYHVGSVYWVMRHFSEFIRPDYVRVQVNYAIKQGIKISAFVSPENDRLASVLINPTKEEVTVQLNGLNVKNSSVYQSVLEDDAYDSGEYYNDLGGLDKNNIIVLKPMSITTVSADLK